MQRRVSEFSAAGQLRMHNTFGDFSGNLQPALDYAAGTEVKDRRAATVQHTEIFSVGMDETQGKPMAVGCTQLPRLLGDSNGCNSMELKDGVAVTVQHTEIFSVGMHATPDKSMAVGCRRSPRFVGDSDGCSGMEMGMKDGAAVVEQQVMLSVRRSPRLNRSRGRSPVEPDFEDRFPASPTVPTERELEEIDKSMKKYEAKRNNKVTIDSRLLKATQGNVGLGELENVCTHRFDRHVLDYKASTKVVYSSQPRGGQRKINGIRFSRINDVGRLCYMLDVCNGTDIWAEEKTVDTKDIDNYDQKIAADSMERNKDVSTEGRHTERYRTRTVGEVTAKDRVRLRPPCNSKADAKNVGRIEHSLKAENVVIMSCKGDYQTIMQDGQVALEVLFVWTNDAHPTMYEKFEAVTLHIGYEPECFCGANCADRPCVHLLGFFMRKCNVDWEDGIMYQVALLTTELEQVREILMRSNGLQIDACARERLDELIRKERMLMLRGAQQRSMGNDSGGRGEAIGESLQKLEKAIKGKELVAGRQINIISVPKKSAKALSPAARSLEKVILMGGQASAIAQQMSLSPCKVMIESPVLARHAGKKKAGGNGQPATQPKPKRRKTAVTTKPPPRLSENPIGEARIYRNWTVDRKCNGSKCYKLIEKGDWFVCLPMRNYIAVNRGSTKVQMYGFCLKDGGACLAQPDMWVQRAMVKCGICIVQCLPVHIHGDQVCDVECLAALGARLYKRPQPYLVSK